MVDPANSALPYPLVCRISEPPADIKKRFQAYTPRPNQRNMAGQKRLQLLEEVTGSKEAGGGFFEIDLPLGSMAIWVV